MKLLLEYKLLSSDLCARVLKNLMMEIKDITADLFHDIQKITAYAPAERHSQSTGSPTQLL